MTYQNEYSKKKKFWKTARGDHIFTAAIFFAVILTLCFAYTWFSPGENFGIYGLVWFGCSLIGGVMIPLSLVPGSWIDHEGKIPPHTFWKELFS